MHHFPPCFHFFLSITNFKNLKSSPNWNFQNIVSNSVMWHQFVPVLSIYSKQFELPKHSFKERQNALFRVIAFFLSSSYFKNIISKSVRMHHLSSMISHRMQHLLPLLSNLLSCSNFKTSFQISCCSGYNFQMLSFREVELNIAI